MTDDEVVEALRVVASAGTLPPPATPEAVTSAEEVIGFSLPPLLRRLYVEVANGGFGPRQGILGVRGGAAQGNFADIADLYQDGPDPSGRIPAGLVLIYDWGCTIWSLVDFRDPAGDMWCNHEGACWPQGVNLAEWLTGTLAGTLTVETLLESQPTS
ncbi:SMI1/KNR4 family protein [Streptomyces xylophagus]|uniref:SMI1/KNR4 family protein n=1 Tax=Streptomyces xylophagus TaxID=285514 RepID=UPI000AD00A0D|nr:SMI1/KNR4 family protein [Streptomyces xylophagus]